MNIKNKTLARSLIVMLAKKVEEMTEDDLSRVENVTISVVDEMTGERAYDLEELRMLPNLKRLCIVNSLLLEGDLALIGSLPCSDVYFDKCMFEEDKFLASLGGKKKVEFHTPFIRDYAFLDSLTNVEILGIDTPYGNKTVPIDKLSNLKGLKKLFLHSCKTSSVNAISSIASQLDTVSFLNTPIDSVDFLDSLRDGTQVIFEHEYNESPITQKNSARLEIKNSLIEFAFDNDEEEVSKNM